MDKNETALNYNQYATPIGRHRQQTWPPPSKSSARDDEALADIFSSMDEYLSSDDHIPSPNNPIYQGWRQAVEANGPHSHMFTLAFRRTYADREAIAALSGWANMMSRSVRGPRWKAKMNGLAGVAFAERHSLSLDFRGRLHFHILIKEQCHLPDTDALKDIACATALRLRDSRGMRMTDPWRIDLREVTNEHRLIGYLLKDIYSQDWQMGDNITFWRPSNGIDGFQFNALTATELTHRH